MSIQEIVEEINSVTEYPVTIHFSHKGWSAINNVSTGEGETPEEAINDLLTKTRDQYLSYEAGSEAQLERTRELRARLFRIEEL